MISCIYCTCCISYRIFYRLFIGFFEETKKPGQLDKHDGEPQGIERTDRDRENRQKGREEDTDPRGDRQDRQPCMWRQSHEEKVDAAQTRTDFNIIIGLSTLSIYPCRTYGKDKTQRIERQIPAKDVYIGQTEDEGKD